MKDIPKHEDLLQLKFFLKDINFVEGEHIGELARRSIQKKTKISCYNNHISNVNNITALFKVFRCNTCDTFFSKTGNLERQLVTCSERVEHIHPKNTYELGGSLFGKLDKFKTPYKNEQKLIRNLAAFDFDSICIKEES